MRGSSSLFVHSPLSYFSFHSNILNKKDIVSIKALYLNIALPQASLIYNLYSNVLMCKFNANSLCWQDFQQLLLLFPSNSHCLESVIFESDTIHCYFSHSQTPSSFFCPYCHHLTSHTRGSYFRHIQTFALHGKACLLHIPVYRCRCTNAECSHKYFSEPLSPFVKKFSRMTACLEEHLIQYVLEVSSVKASYLLSCSGISVSASTLTRHLMQYPFPPVTASDQIGIDDFAYKKGSVYASVIVDQRIARPIDFLDSRDSDEVRQWLEANPQVTLVTRDGGRCFSCGISAVRRAITQVTDRFHLFQTLSENLKAQFAKDFSEHVSLYMKSASSTSEQWPEEEVYSILRKRIESLGGKKQGKLQLWFEIRNCKRNNLSCGQISDTLGISSIKVKNYLKRKQTDFCSKQQIRLYSKCRTIARYFSQNPQGNAQSALKYLPQSVYRNVRYKEMDYLYQGLQGYAKKDGEDNKKEIRKKYTVNTLIKTLYATKRTEDKIISKFIEEYNQMDMYLVWYLVAQFRQTIMNEQNAYTLNQWVRMAESSGIDFIEKFAANIRTEFKAVWQAKHSNLSNGILEGTVNKIKTIKRQMYGRAKLKLLMIKTIYAHTG
ncbi:ISL3 family transposase [Bacteroides congonensis]|uniref:ISL3 family transposase n=2 Tax=Bacteroides congonensis TaxID=1871006 RepID=UPI0030B8776D